MTSVLIEGYRETQRHRHIQREGSHVKREAEIEMIQLKPRNAKDYQQ